MTDSTRLLLAQFDPMLGNIEANAQQIISIIKAHQDTHDLILFPELSLTGYPPEDLLFRNELHLRVEQQLIHIAQAVKACYVVVGHPQKSGLITYNAATVLHDGCIVAHYHKQCLPNYRVFDEKRYFTAGEKTCVLNIHGQSMALCICEDIWHEQPLADAVAQGASTVLCLNASPFYAGKQQLRENIVSQAARKHRVNIAYVNAVGGQDELVFDGHSFAVDNTGKLLARSPGFKTDCLSIDLSHHNLNKIAPAVTDEAEIYQALVTGTRDYVIKNGFKSALIGLSGGIDSALTLAIAHDALGSTNVHAVMMPSRYTATMSTEDAAWQAHKLQVKYATLAIEPIFKQFIHTLTPEFTGKPQDATEENLQARIRGTLLMALSNKHGAIVLTTGNKSEMAVGYATLYGDMAGGFAVLKDVPKTLVYRLANYRNSLSAIIPKRVITRAPSAELRANQTDQDSLPDYTILDKILHHYVEEDMGKNDIINLGYAPNDVERILHLIDLNEYKRRQAPPGIRISPRAFGRDWRYPITSGFQKA